MRERERELEIDWNADRSTEEGSLFASLTQFKIEWRKWLQEIDRYWTKEWLLKSISRRPLYVSLYVRNTGKYIKFKG